ncbi:hypothetical protein HK104_003891 [Borealophlyctis nickersoniae]|nr:hypothetical protein HK104_003891 [Borealophlyctis nickersoniae]
MQGFRKMLQACKRLTALDIDFPALNDDDLWMISSSCEQLRALSVVSGADDTGRVTDEGIAAVAKNCERLRHFRIRVVRYQHERVDRITDRGFRAVADACRGKLLTFALEWMVDYARPVVGSLFGQGGLGAVEDAAEVERRLGEALRDIVEGNPGLVTLAFEWPVGAESILSAAAESLTFLKTLRVGYIRNLELVAPVIAANRHLKSLRIAGVNNSIDPARLLGPLRVPNPPPLPDSPHLDTLELLDVESMRDTLRLITSMPYLTRLRVLPSRRAAALYHDVPTDEVVVDVAKSCHRLRFFEVPVRSDHPVLHLAANCPDLEEIDLVEGREVTDYAIILLAKRCTRLKTVYLGSAALLTDRSVVTLAREAGEGLQRVVLPFGNPHLTGATLAALAEHCPNLEVLENLPATVSVAELLEHLPKLTRLVVLGVCRISAAGSYIGQQQGFGLSVSREDQDRIKAACKRLRHMILD